LAAHLGWGRFASDRGRGITLKSLLLTLLLPPTNLALLAALGVLLQRSALVVIGIAGLLILSLPIVADSMLAALDVDPPPPVTAPAAIVILSAETERDAAPPHATIPGPLTLERVRTGVELARRTGLPVLVTGGQVEAHAEPAAVVMARSLQTDFGTPARWVEARSATTWENATNSAAILKPLGIGSVFLVTHGWHMRRALVAFRAAGLQATPVPVRHDPWPGLGLDEFLPQAKAWHTSFYALHEWIGTATYALLAWLYHH
jgi:uncharacterized SAM-binding protein YcdF (DUF218 family)